MDTGFAQTTHAPSEGQGSSPVQRVQRVLEVTETNWKTPDRPRRQAGAVARRRSPIPGAMARRV